MAIQLGDIAPDFTQDSTAGSHSLSRVARQVVGHPVLAPQGLHPGLHDGARRRRQAQAGVRQAQRQGPRGQRRRRRVAQEVGRRHRGDAGHEAQLPDPRRPGSQGGDPLRDDPPERERHAHRALGVRHRPEQEGAPDAHLPGEHRAATSTRSCASSTRCSSPTRTRSRPRPTGRTATRSSSSRRCRTPRSSSRSSRRATRS